MKDGVAVPAASVRAFRHCDGIAAVILLDNVDTDVIIPMDKLLTSPRVDLGRWAFAPLRYRSDGSEDAGFVLNREHYRNAKILLTGGNFGCGSSREAAAVALWEFGFRVVIAPSFGDIFRSNCVKNGILPIVLPEPEMAELSACAEKAVGKHCFVVSLEDQTITLPLDQQKVVRFQIDDASRNQLLSGQDEIAETSKLMEEIRRYQERDRRNRPWVWLPLEAADRKRKL